MVISQFLSELGELKEILISHTDDVVAITFINPTVTTTDDTKRWRRSDPLRLEFTEENFNKLKKVLAG